MSQRVPLSSGFLNGSCSGGSPVAGRLVLREALWAPRATPTLSVSLCFAQVWMLSDPFLVFTLTSSVMEGGGHWPRKFSLTSFHVISLLAGFEKQRDWWEIGGQRKDRSQVIPPFSVPSVSSPTWLNLSCDSPESSYEVHTSIKRPCPWAPVTTHAPCLWPPRVWYWFHAGAHL